MGINVIEGRQVEISHTCTSHANGDTTVWFKVDAGDVGYLFSKSGESLIANDLEPMPDDVNGIEYDDLIATLQPIAHVAVSHHN